MDTCYHVCPGCCPPCGEDARFRYERRKNHSPNHLRNTILSRKKIFRKRYSEIPAKAIENISSRRVFEAIKKWFEFITILDLLGDSWVRRCRAIYTKTVFFMLFKKLLPIRRSSSYKNRIGFDLSGPNENRTFPQNDFTAISIQLHS